jgi:hypothetical protein
MKTQLLITLILLFLIQSMKGVTLTGSVTDKETGQPIEAATIFIPGTTISTQTNRQGNYSLHYSLSGNQQLIIKHVTYQTSILDLTTDSLYDIRLPKIVRQLNEVKVSGKDPNRQINLKRFWYNFSGMSKIARSCKLENPETLNFRRLGAPGDAEFNTTLATADSNLIIENKALGYQIQYTLLYYIRSSERTIFQGYPLFIDLYKSKEVPEKIAQQRAKAYFGSSMHFFRSLYANKLEAAGFYVYEVALVANLPGDQQNYGLLGNPLFIGKTGYHYEQTTNPLNLIKMVNKSADKGAFSYSFPIEVRYTKGVEENAYKAQAAYHYRIGLQRTPKQQTSLLVLTNGSMDFFPDGSYGNPDEVITLGYWDFKRMGEMLPLDYVPVEE